MSGPDKAANPGRDRDKLRSLFATEFSDVVTRILVADPSGRLVYMNPAMQTFLRALIRDFFPNYNDFLPLSTQAATLAELPLPAAFRVLFARAAKTRTVIKQSFPLEGLGRTARIAARVSPLVPEGGAEELLVVTLDLEGTLMPTLSNDAFVRERLEDFARSTTDWLWETDADGLISFVNDQVLRSTGQTAAMLRGRSFAAIGVFSTEEGYQSAPHAMAHKLPFRDKIMMTVDPQGEERLLRVSGVPIFDAQSGRFQGFRGTATDVTEGYRTAEKLQEVNEQLQHTVAILEARNEELDVARGEVQDALNARNEFLASMSHELRTPLNGIIGFAEVMSAQLFGELNERYVDYASDIHNAGKHLLSLIDDLLDSSRLDTDELGIALKEVDLNDVIEEVLSVLRRDVEAKQHTLEYKPRKKTTLVHADAKRVKQILLNLVGNAIKFTPNQGSIGIEIKKAREPKTDRKIAQIEVWDTGLGIPVEFRSQIFDKFDRGAADLEENGEKGFGLGLYISDQLAKRMDGMLVLTRSSEQGSAFTLSLPLA